MKRFGLGLLGLVVIAGAFDSVSLIWIVLASVLCLALMLYALSDIIE